MGLVCGICKREIPAGNAKYCGRCRAPFHNDCLTRYLGTYHKCPHCGIRATLFDFTDAAMDLSPLADKGPSAGDMGMARPQYRPERSESRGIPNAPSGSRPVHRMEKTHIVDSAPARKKPAEKAAAPAPEVKKAPSSPQKKKRGGVALFVISMLVTAMLVAGAYYVQDTYVGYFPHMQVDSETKDIMPGQVVDYMVTVQNSGNLIASYDLAIDEQKAVLPEGWNAWIIEDDLPSKDVTLVLDPLESVQKTVRISASGNVQPETQASVPVMVSANDGRYFDDVTLIARAMASYNYSLEQGDSKKYVSAGQTAEFSAIIRNTGTISDTYVAQLSGITQGWNGALKISRTTVSAGQSAQMIFTLQSPLSASGNETGAATLKIMSQNDPEDVKTLTYQLIVNPSYGFEILATETSKVVLPGGSTTFIFKVRNVGNTSDNYTISAGDTLPAGWAYELSKSTISVEDGDEVTVGLTVSTPDSAPAELEGPLTLTFRSAASSDIETQSFMVTIAESQDKLILIELFTSVNCTFCPFAEEAVEMLTGTYPNKFVVLAYHTNDSFQNDMSSIKFGSYTLPGNPSVVFDGTKKVVGGTTESYEKYVAKVGELIGEQPLVRIEPISITDSVTVQGKKLVRVLLSPQGSALENQLNVYFVAYRNGISPATIQSKVYNHVVTEGEVKTISGLADDMTVSAEISIPEDGGLVVFVQDRTTNKVYQSIVI